MGVSRARSSVLSARAATTRATRWRFLCGGPSATNFYPCAPTARVRRRDCLLDRYRARAHHSKRTVRASISGIKHRPQILVGRCASSRRSRFSRTYWLSLRSQHVRLGRSGGGVLNRRRSIPSGCWWVSVSWPLTRAQYRQDRGSTTPHPPGRDCRTGPVAIDEVMSDAKLSRPILADVVPFRSEKKPTGILDARHVPMRNRRRNNWPSGAATRCDR